MGFVEALRQVRLHRTPATSQTERVTGRRTVLPTVAVLLSLLCFVLLIIRLPTTPPLWWDEGWTLSVARNWVEAGHYGRFLVGAAISPRLAASPVVVLPVALSLRLFGVGGWQGRLPGVLLTLLTLWLLYRLTGTLYSRRAAVIALVLALLTPMAPELQSVFIGRQVLGEMTVLCLLLSGYLVLFAGLSKDQPAASIVAGLLWGLAVVAKTAVIPFLTVSVASVAIVLCWKRDWRTLLRFVLPFLLAALAFFGWRVWLQRHLTPQAAEGIMGSLLGVTALVPELSARLVALMVTLLSGLPILVSLTYAARHHLDATPRGLERLALWSLAASWFAWYVLLSVGWVRYLFPAAFLSLIFFAGLLKDATDDFDPGTLRSIWQRLRPGRWRQLARPQQLAALLLLIAVPVSVTALARTYLHADDSVFRLAAYLRASVSPDALVETYDPEIMFLTDQPYHFPPDQMHVQLNRRTFLGDQTVEIDYDPLAAKPDYLLVGPYARLWGLYPEDLLAQHFQLEEQFGPYDLYRSTGAASTSHVATTNDPP